MHSEKRALRARGFAALSAAGLVLSGCSGTSTASPETLEAEQPPALLEEVPGSDIPQIVLSEPAAARLGIETAPITAVGRSSAGALTAMPYGALLYDVEGNTWAYTVSESLTYGREPVTVKRIVGDEVQLAKGPGVGTEVVTVGAAELFGAEMDVGH